MNEKAEKRLFLVDGYSYLFRAYHSLPPFTNPEGTPVGAVFGFTNMMIKLKNKIETNNSENIYFIIVFDSGKTTFRNEIYSEYKANRPEAPEDLKPQFSLIRDAADALNIEVVELNGFEADDIIATFSKKAQENNFKITIVSGDKDLMQLVNDNVCIYDPMRDKIINAPEVKEKFGVPPKKVLDILSLMGDSSDNIPGVPGIGSKTAAELINEYGDIPNLINNLDNIKQEKRRNTLKDNIENIYLSQKLASLHCDVPVDLNLDKYKLKENNLDKLINFLSRHNFKSLLARYNLKKEGISQEIIEKKEIKSSSGMIKFNSPAELNDSFKRYLNSNVTIYYNPELKNFIAINFDGKESGILNIQKPILTDNNFGDLFSYQNEPNKQQKKNSDYADLIEKYFEDDSYNFIFYNLKHLLNNDIFSKAPRSFDDIKVLGYLLDSSKALESLDKKITTEEELIIHIDLLISNFQSLKNKIFNQKENYIYSEIELPLISVLHKMEVEGIKIDKNILFKLENEFNFKLINLSKEIFDLAGEEFNIGSPKQLGEILFQKLNIEGGKKSKSGQFITDSDTLEDLGFKGYRIADKILEWRGLSKLISTYTTPLQKEADNNSIIHTTFNNTATATGRLSSTNPNLQNIPIRTEEGKRIRTAFIAKNGNILIDADYSQIELRLLAHIADIEVLKNAFREGKDIHAATAAEVFSVPIEEVTPELRRKAKTVNFGIIYGQSSFGLAKQLQISRTEAKNIIDKYFLKYTGIKKYMEETIIFARKHSYVETLFGRKIYLSGINDKNPARRNFQERAAINAPLQGTAADIIKKAMIQLSTINNQSSTELLLQIHDELIFECPENHAEENAKMIKNIMENSANLSVPLTVDINIGKNWGETH